MKSPPASSEDQRAAAARSEGPRGALSPAEVASWLKRLEAMLASETTGAATEHGASAAQPWQSWLVLRAQGPASSAAVKGAVRTLLDSPAAPPKLLQAAPRLAVLAALLGAKVTAPLDALESPAGTSASELALRIEILSLLELQNPSSQSRTLTLVTQRGLNLLRHQLRAREPSLGARGVAELLGTFELAQAVFRASPLVNNADQAKEVRRSFAGLDQLTPELAARAANEAVLLHAAAAESVAAYVHVQRQQGAPRALALEQKLVDSIRALLAQLEQQTSNLDANFAARYALTSSARALRLTRTVLAP